MATIVRVFQAEAKAGMESEFREFFVNEALPLVKVQPGVTAVSIGLPLSHSPASFLMVSTWSNLEALKGFAGDNWTEAVIDPREEHLLERVSVSHYGGDG